MRPLLAWRRCVTYAAFAVGDSITAVWYLQVRETLAQFVSTPEAPVTKDDIILSSGCSHALQMAIEVIGNDGDNILVPRPGFPLYSTLMKPIGIEVCF